MTIYLSDSSHDCRASTPNGGAEVTPKFTPDPRPLITRLRDKSIINQEWEDEAADRIATLESESAEAHDILIQTQLDAGDLLNEKDARIATLEVDRDTWRKNAFAAMETITSADERISTLEALLNDPVKLRAFIDSKIATENPWKHAAPPTEEQP